MYACPKAHTRTLHNVQITQNIEWKFANPKKNLNPNARMDIFVLSLEDCESLNFINIIVPDDPTRSAIFVSPPMTLYYACEEGKIGYMRLNSVTDDL